MADVHKLERDFCSNFKCCHVKLSNLHALFDHFESCHPGSDISDLSFSVPCLGPSSDVLHIPAPPSSPRKLKSLFIRVPLPPIPPVSPIESDSLSTSPSSTPEPSPVYSRGSQRSQPISRTSSSGSISSPSVFNHFQGPSIQTRNKMYTLAVPSTPHMDQPDATLSWDVSAPIAFSPEATVGYGNGYCYYPAAPPVMHPVAVSVSVAVPGRPSKSGVPPNVEVIDVDLISSSPDLSRPPSATPIPDASVSPAGPPSTPTPPSASLPTPVSAPAPSLPSPALPAPASSPLSSAPHSPALSSLPPSPWTAPPSAAVPASSASFFLFPPPSTSSPHAAADPDAISHSKHADSGPPCDLATLASVAAAAAPALVTFPNAYFGSPLRTCWREAVLSDVQSDVAAALVTLAEADSGVAWRTENADAMQVDGAAGTTAHMLEVELLGRASGEGDASVDVTVPSQNEDAVSEQMDDVEAQMGDAEGHGEAAAVEGGAEDEDDDTIIVPAPPMLHMNNTKKPHVCPIPLCIKAYQTPNGLRYHAERGTCIMENGEPCPTSLSLSLLDAAIASSRTCAGTTVSTGAEALGRAGNSKPGRGSGNGGALPRRRLASAPARQSTRLASSVAKEKIAATGKRTTRIGVKAMSKGVTSKPMGQSKFKAKSPAAARAASPSSVASPSSDPDDSESDTDMSGDDSD
ncbi:hypothetical protein MVEN_02138600 [Mycena venus]|uniref:C2H2-type domain-containing protein n=1 Tax=Mycena venus TaxID=2733690 RepID=A0A8H6X9B1_9AGAR|nr:hypothetical protein MVEN_02138600 [Mycena venus]